MQQLMSIIENNNCAGMFIFFHNVNVQQYSKITFLFLLFSMSEGLSPLTCV